eukprot:15440219-Alexandrium_andersonii.AAC.2
MMCGCAGAWVRCACPSLPGTRRPLHACLRRPHEEHHGRVRPRRDAHRAPRKALDLENAATGA